MILNYFSFFNSCAVTLGALRISSQALTYARSRPIMSTVVSDKEAVQACLQFAGQLKYEFYL